MSPELEAFARLTGWQPERLGRISDGYGWNCNASYTVRGDGYLSYRRCHNDGEWWRFKNDYFEYRCNDCLTREFNAS